MSKIFPEIKFNIGTTSFIKWDSWSANVRFLADKVDYIQILVLEDYPQDYLPSPAQLKELKTLKDDLQLHYAVHLPHRVQLASLNQKTFNKSIDRIKYVLELLDILKPDYHVLHTYIYDTYTPELLKTSVANIDLALSTILQFYPYPRRIGLETLHYEFSHLDQVVNKHDTSVVVDIGQALRYNKDYRKYLTNYYERIVDIHLHGFDGEKDHESLKYMDTQQLKAILRQIIDLGYSKNLMLEVFTEEAFNESMDVLKQALASTIKPI